MGDARPIAVTWVCAQSRHSFEPGVSCVPASQFWMWCGQSPVASSPSCSPFARPRGGMENSESTSQS
eukprot:6381647-Prymnesium_polylepis.2